MEPVWKGGGPDAPPPSTTNSPPHIVQVTVFVSLSQHVTTLPLDGGEPIYLRRRHGGWPAVSLLGKCRLSARGETFLSVNNHRL